LLLYQKIGQVIYELFASWATYSAISWVHYLKNLLNRPLFSWIQCCSLNDVVHYPIHLCTTCHKVVLWSNEKSRIERIFRCFCTTIFVSLINSFERRRLANFRIIFISGKCNYTCMLKMFKEILSKAQGAR